MKPAPSPVVQSAALQQGSGAAAQGQVAADRAQGQNGGNRAQRPDATTGATPQATATGQDRSRGQSQSGADARSRPVAGSVVSIEGDVATVSTQQGEVKVKLSGAKIQKMVEGTVDDLKAGERVMVTGQQGSDGSYSATIVQIVPAGDGATQPQAGPGPQATPAATPAGR